MAVICHPASYVGLSSTFWDWVVDVMHGRKEGETVGAQDRYRS